jgi:hypothetical protein
VWDTDQQAKLLERMVMASSVPVVPTVGEIARRVGVPIHRVEYVIRTRNIHPTGWAGNARVFTDAEVAYIASELRRIDEEKGVEHD